MKEFWNSRFEETDTFYGQVPNDFFKDFIDRMPVGRVLLPGEGEGRNAIYAASRGWGVEAFDWSEAARAAAAENAETAGVMLHYELKEIAAYKPLKKYDLVALVYVHLPEAERKEFHKKLVQSLEPGGYIIMEAFAKNQPGNIVAGPGDPSLYYSAADIEKDFAELNISLCDEEILQLNEGELHNSQARVIHFVGRRPY
ncbi:MAG TPA: methyltransferase domain-containing protein [Chitinophagaceae bacterium]|nr:methyltransferase domain-containing protein [Chitinophagaceae bacterium]